MEDDVAEDWRWLCAEPDELEHEIIRVVSAIPEQAENWIDGRSGIKRLIEKMRSANALPALQERAIREKWTNEIAFRKWCILDFWLIARGGLNVASAMRYLLVELAAEPALIAIYWRDRRREKGARCRKVVNSAAGLR